MFLFKKMAKNVVSGAMDLTKRLAGKVVLITASTDGYPTVSNQIFELPYKITI